MNKFMILAMFVILAGTTIMAVTGVGVIGSALAQDNATMAGNMTAGNMTGGNMTDAVGSISGNTR